MNDLRVLSITNVMLDHINANFIYLSGISPFQLLNKILESLVHDRGSPFLAALTSDLHVLPDFHGNRYIQI